MVRKHITEAEATPENLETAKRLVQDHLNFIESHVIVLADWIIRKYQLEDYLKKAALPSDNKPLTKCSCNNHNIRVMCLGCGGHVEDL